MPQEAAQSVKVPDLLVTSSTVKDDIDTTDSEPIQEMASLSLHTSEPDMTSVCQGTQCQGTNGEW